MIQGYSDAHKQGDIEFYDHDIKIYRHILPDTLAIAI